MNEARKGVKNKAKAAKSKSGGSGFAKSWIPKPTTQLRPAEANRLAQQLQTGRFSVWTTPNPSNPGCAGVPRSVIVLPN